MGKKLIYLFIIIFPVGSLLANDDPPEDTTQILLLENINIQLEATQAINDMYNFRFAKAERQFRWIKQKYPNHPLAYFLLALSEWWKINVNIDNKSYDEKFLAYIDTVLIKAEKLYKIPQFKVESAFFLSAGYGFQGRLYSERGTWGKAAVAGKNSLKFLNDSKGRSYLSPELLFGDGLYNYFSVWIPENYPMLKPLMVFFEKGDMELGLKQLRTVSTNAFYTRTEAQYFLMRILAFEENDLPGALQISEYLNQIFPDNAYFHRFYARILYSTGQFRKAEAESLEILHRIDSGQVGYEAVSGRYAAFYMGQISEQRRDWDKAKYFYQRTLDFAHMVGAEDSGYYLYAMLAMGEIAIKEGDNELAETYFKQVKKDAKKKTPVYKRAKSLLKDM